MVKMMRVLKSGQLGTYAHVLMTMHHNAMMQKQCFSQFGVAFAGWNPCPHGPLCIVSWAEQTAMDSAGWTRWCSTPLRKYISVAWTLNLNMPTGIEHTTERTQPIESQPWHPWIFVNLTWLFDCLLSLDMWFTATQCVEKCWTTCSARCMPLALACFVGPVDAWHEYLDHEGQQASVFEFEHLSFFVLA